MIPSTLSFSRVWFSHFIFLLAALSFGLTIPAQAAQEIFWPFNSFPPPGSSLSYTNASTISVSVPGVGTITTRYPKFSDFINPSVLPGPSNSVVFNNASTRFDTDSSLDGGANWAPYVGFGPISLTLTHTNEAPGVRRFEMELSSQDILVNGAYGAATVRESPTVASLGELVVTATNGGLFYRGFVNFYLEVSVDNGGSWYAFSPAAYVELSGPAGVPTSLSISKSDATVTICWRTEVNGQYQLQRSGVLGGTNWTDVGSLELGNGSEVCVSESISTATNQFYRLQLSP